MSAPPLTQWEGGGSGPQERTLLGATRFKGCAMMNAFLLGACPRCDGDLARSRDHWGTYWHCLQCGWHETGPVQQRADLPRWLTGAAPAPVGHLTHYKQEG